MFSSEHHVGRLIELRIETPVDRDEMARLAARHARVVAEVDGPAVIAVDLRGAMVFPGEISDQFLGLMHQLNERFERSAILINESAILGLQAERVIQAAGNPNRRAFRASEPMIAWLAEMLTGDESRRLRTWLLGDPQKST